MIKKIIPSFYYNSIYDIPYKKLYDEGKRLILTDLDNTLISYKESMPTNRLYIWLKEVTEIGYEVIIVSNSKKKRVEEFGNSLGVKFVKLALKPLKKGLKKGLKIASKKYDKNEVLFLGDQLMTDIIGSNRMGFTTCLIKAIDRESEYFFTKINRKIEKHLLKKCKKKYSDLYDKTLKEYYLNNYDNKKM